MAARWEVRFRRTLTVSYNVPSEFPVTVVFHSLSKLI